MSKGPMSVPLESVFEKSLGFEDSKFRYTLNAGSSIPYVGVTTSHHAGVPYGWTMYVHPLGWIYFRNDPLAIVTDEDIRDPSVLAPLSNYCDCQSHLLPEGHEVYMLSAKGPGLELFVNHTQCVAAFERENIQDKTLLDSDIYSIIRRRRLYYNYLQQHPSHVALPEWACGEAIDAINSYQLDYFINGPSSVSPFSKVECDDLIKVLEGIIAQPRQDSPSTTSFLAWVLKDIYGFRQRDRYGRLTRKQLTDARVSSIRPPRATHLPVFAQRLLSFLIAFPFFGIPRTYLAHTKVASEPRGRLADMEESWENYTEQLTREYSDFVLASTVLLSATVGFLALPDIEIVAKAFGIVSIFASLCSIIIGVFFTWRHHRRVPSSITMAYIHNARNNPLGLEGHAVLLSLPPTFLVWSIITFTAGVLAYTCQHVTVKSAFVWAILGIFAVFIGLLFIGLSTFSRIWVWKRKQSWA